MNEAPKINAAPRLATPTEARAIAALFLAAGATPQEVDGAVQELIFLSKDNVAPRSYGEIAQQTADAIASYRSKLTLTAVALNPTE